jgi:hypothetical protein
VRLPISVTAAFGKRALEVLPVSLRTALAGLLKQIDAIRGHITGYDKKIGELAGHHPELKRMESIPGVGRLTALTFVLTLGRAERFAHSRDVAGFLGLRPKQRQSGARDPQLGISKAAILICASCWCSAPHSGLLRQRLRTAPMATLQSRRRKESSLRAIVAVARKLILLSSRCCEEPVRSGDCVSGLEPYSSCDRWQRRTLTLNSTCIEPGNNPLIRLRMEAWVEELRFSLTVSAVSWKATSQRTSDA